MKRLIKWLVRIILLLLVLIVVMVLSLDFILRKAATGQIQAETGMDASIGRFSVGVRSPYVTIENLKLYNTPEFGGTPFLDLKELHIEYDREALAEEKLRFKLVRFNLAEVNVVVNEAGHTNIVDLLAKAAAAKSGKERSMAEKRLEKIKFDGIEVLNLTLGSIRYINLKDPTQNKELKLGVQNQVLKNINNQDELMGAVILALIRGGGLSLGGGDNNPVKLLELFGLKPGSAPASSP